MASIWRALVFMIVSTLSFTVMNSLIKSLEGIHTFQIVFFRCFGSLIICVSYLKFHKIPMLGNQKKLMIGRGIVGVTSMFLFFTALKFIPFGTTVSLRYLAPIFAAILSVFLLKEKIKSIQWLFFLVSFAGVALIKGIDVRVSTFGLVILLSSALLSGCVYVFLRAIGSRDHPVVVVNYFMAVSTLLSAAGAIFYWQRPDSFEWLILISLGIFGYIGQVYMTKAFQVAEANKVAPMKYFEAIFSIFAGWIFFSEGYSVMGLLGIVLVLGGMLLNMLVKSE